ncbi:hypothetical protein [Bacteroides pyogenes]|uniref:Uncharacterized protein n=1 Tax=Bacteroides pyogenes TaxID=310300 RepID=A0A5D3EMT6_9BACE|nr:hypothetical protein [Bacteroides pyogenes]MBR8708167.1 hypothetical protein [Bacteroides pyogenes]MBR8746510.1 hypothetical protein [Bacteroides pyogenes]MBR8756782.1 hypothetical protein [Bacteroides pyogenes]MBR8780036.1 hypothetical protein [Bacteroides pyogenes]MCI7070714.1 hypothetical protein [Bacteroides pyogenes]
MPKEEFCLEIIITFVGDKEFFAGKTKQYIANGTVAKSLPENQPIARNALVQRVIAFLSKVIENNRIFVLFYE